MWILLNLSSFGTFMAILSYGLGVSVSRYPPHEIEFCFHNVPKASCESPYHCSSY